jgi:hypothetical protein
MNFSTRQATPWCAYMEQDVHMKTSVARALETAHVVDVAPCDVLRERAKEASEGLASLIALDVVTERERRGMLPGCESVDESRPRNAQL